MNHDIRKGSLKGPEPVPGLFEYHGMGCGYLHLVGGGKVWLWKSEAVEKAKELGLDFKYCDIADFRRIV
jgi:hypothetical protein